LDSSTFHYFVHGVQLDPGPPLAFGGIGDSPANRIKPEVPHTAAVLRLDTIAFDDVSIPLNPSRPLNEPVI
jgi:hypothetical protein